MRAAALASALALAGCADYASEQALSQVDARVRDVAATQVSVTTRIESRIDAGFKRMDRLEQNQAQAQVVLAQMGEGFNVLSDAAQRAHESAEDVGRRQRRLEADVKRRLDELRPLPIVVTPEAPTLLVGRGRDVRNGLALEPLLLRLTGATPQLEVPGVPGGARPLLNVSELGDRLYAVGADPEVAWCLDVVAREGAYRFTAARCDAPFAVYAFSVT